MALLTIDLQEGFFGDQVLISSQGKQVYENGNVSTRMQIGLADTIVIKDIESPVDLTISLQKKNINRTIRLTIERDLYLGVRIENQTQILFEQQFTPFWYA